MGSGGSGGTAGHRAGRSRHVSGNTVVAAPVETSADRVAALLERAEQSRAIGDYQAGAELARRAAALAESIGDVSARASALRSLATQLMRLGEHEASVTACRDAVAALEGIGDEA